MRTIDSRKWLLYSLSPSQLAAGDDRRIHHGINKARDAITAKSGCKEGAGILDNDYKAAFDYMVLHWVFKVLRAKGLNQDVTDRMANLYRNNLTVVVVNKIPGRYNYMYIRQGDRQSSNLFCYGINPHITWLMNSYKVFGYIDDIKNSP